MRALASSLSWPSVPLALVELHAGGATTKPVSHPAKNVPSAC